MADMTARIARFRAVHLAAATAEAPLESDGDQDRRAWDWLPSLGHFLGWDHGRIKESFLAVRYHGATELKYSVVR